MATETKAMTTKELTDAVSQLLERDERRAEEERRKARRRIRDRHRKTHDSIAQLTKSIEIIKWCIVSITGVMVVSLVIMIMIVMEVEREAERIKGEVQRIQRQAEMIREKMRHPLETLGGTLGRQLESNIGGFLEADKGDE